MVTTGSSFSAATPERAAPPDALDLVVGVQMRAGETAAATVGVLQSVLAAVAPSLRWRLVVATADTGELRQPVVTEANVVHRHYVQQPSDALQVPYHGIPGRARALHAILEEAHTRRARACVVLDPHTIAGAGGVDDLLRPLLDDSADLVTPVYTRHPYSGAIVHGILYPLFRAIYGVRVRYPIGTDIGLSRALIEAVLPDTVWESDAGQIGIDLWLAATAACAGFRLAQAHVGQRVDEPPGLDLGAILGQVVGFCFLDMERRAASWQRARSSVAVPVFGEPAPMPAAVAIDPISLVESFRTASRDLQDVWAEVLPPLAVIQWRRLATAPPEAFRVEDALWARTLYDFAMAHRMRVMNRDHLLGSLSPLYLAWLASFVRETRHLPPEEAERAIDRLCLVFEAEKPYLVSQWRWPERFKPMKRRTVGRA